MNPWGYLLLIAALLVLAGMMLYARFSNRSRAKSLHHAPADWRLDAEEGAAPEIAIPADEPEARPLVRLDRAPAPVESDAMPAAATDRDYIDELQEAAAGLAKLMRSSPAPRSEPVVFAPEPPVIEAREEEEAVAVADPAESLAPEAVEPEAHHQPSAESAGIVADAEHAAEEAFVSMERLLAEPVVAMMEGGRFAAAAEAPAPCVLSVRERLGDAVGDQFDRIDAGLDLLEDLVNGIAGSLALLGDFESNHRFEASAPDAIAAAA